VAIPELTGWVGHLLWPWPALCFPGSRCSISR